MHSMCIYHIPQGLNFRIFFKIFMTKLLLKEQTYVFLKNPFFGHIWVNFCPILKIFSTIMIREARSLSYAHILLASINIRKIEIFSPHSEMVLFLKILFFGHILVNFYPILKIFGTIMIEEVRF